MPVILPCSKCGKTTKAFSGADPKNVLCGKCEEEGPGYIPGTKVNLKKAFKELNIRADSDGIIHVTGDEVHSLVFYHGTSEANAAEIKKKGLAAQSYNRGYPVLTTSRSEASMWGRNINPGTKVMIIEFKIDPAAQEQYLEYSVKGGSPNKPPYWEYGIKKPLPASYIKRISEA